MFPLFNLSILDRVIESIKKSATEGLEMDELSGCFLLDVTVKGDKVEVYADADEGIKFSQCQKLSRHIEAYLDESLLIGEKYALVVSSPGAEKPLILFRQYPRNVGRTMEFKMKDETVITGKMLSVENQDINIEIQGKKKKEVELKVIPFEEIAEAKVIITFSKK